MSGCFSTGPTPRSCTTRPPIDNAFTRPWTALKGYRRMKGELGEDNCNEDNNHVEIKGEIYYLSADGYLMPAKKNQKPPDLRYFTQN